jgi:hypothetical protein
MVDLLVLEEPRLVSNLPPSQLLIIRHHTADHRKRPPRPPDYDDAV